MFILFSGCKREDNRILLNNDQKKVEYYSSKKYGYKMSISDKQKNFDYLIRLTSNGDVIAVYKYPTRYNHSFESTQFLQETQFLVSNLPDSSTDGKLFGNPILGYYGAKYMDFIIENKFKGDNVEVRESEKMMLREIDSLMEKKRIGFNLFSVKNKLFWFRYELSK